MRKSVVLGAVAAFVLVLAVPGVAAASSAPSFGPNVIVFNPSMSQASIQSTLSSPPPTRLPHNFVVCTMRRGLNRGSRASLWELAMRLLFVMKLLLQPSVETVAAFHAHSSRGTVEVVEIPISSLD